MNFDIGGNREATLCVTIEQTSWRGWAPRHDPMFRKDKPDWQTCYPASGKRVKPMSVSPKRRA